LIRETADARHPIADAFQDRRANACNSRRVKKPAIVEIPGFYYSSFIRKENFDRTGGQGRLDFSV
jgi:hypothetical protein